MIKWIIGYFLMGYIVALYRHARRADSELYENTLDFLLWWLVILVYIWYIPFNFVSRLKFQKSTRRFRNNSQ